MPTDLQETLRNLRAGRTSAAAEMERCIGAAEGPANRHAFLRTSFGEARARAADPAVAALPLAGLAVSVKDLFDVAGQPTHAGSTVRSDAPPTASDAAAVARLRKAGAAFIGRTNMVEFAFSGVGVNPHHGTPANACDSTTPRIPGGSSSGAATSVATGAAFIGLGSDTGGSIRIPAALQGIVGFKNTARLVPLDGAFPLSTTLDTVCAMTRSVEDAILAHEILAARTVTRATAPLAGYRFAVAGTLMLEGLDATVAKAFGRAVEAFRAAGARVDELPLAPLGELTAINATGGFSAAESYALHRGVITGREAEYDPRVAARILRGKAMLAHDYIDLLEARRAWIAQMARAMAGYDAILSPTVPIVAPPIAEVAPGKERDQEFFRVNGLLLRNTSVVNFLDGCAISIPCHGPGELPVGMMLWHGALRDDTVLNAALQAEKLLSGTR